MNLNALNQVAAREGKAPWSLSFSFGRALQASVLHCWQGKEEDKEAAQRVAEGLARVNSLACQGKYDPATTPHPSLLTVNSLHETFRGWSGQQAP